MGSSVGCVNPGCTRRLNFDANTREGQVDAVVNSRWDMVGSVFCCPDHQDIKWEYYVKQSAQRQIPTQERITR
jgi:hypothetical protein